MHQRLSQIFSPRKEEREPLISVPQKAAEVFGYLSEEATSEVANYLRLPESKAYGVASFHA